MNQVLITIAAVILVGCMGTSKENFIILHDKPVSEILTKDPTDLLLYDAAFEGNIKLVGKYLAGGININTKNEVGNTALHYAAFNHKWKIVDFLVALTSCQFCFRFFVQK